MVNEYASMLGATIESIGGAEVGSERMVFNATDGRRFVFFHYENCCESVQIDDIVGDVADLIGSPLVEAEEVSSDGAEAPKNAESYTWTFYRFSTAKGSVTVKWLGESNGYYSESVAFAEEGS